MGSGRHFLSRGELTMAEIVNLRQARKARERNGKEQAAAVNRAKFGEAKSAKSARAVEQARSAKALDGQKREQD